MNLQAYRCLWDRCLEDNEKVSKEAEIKSSQPRLWRNLGGTVTFDRVANLMVACLQQVTNNNNMNNFKFVHCYGQTL